MKSPGTMRALQLQSPGRLCEVCLPIPVPGPEEVLIATAATTICTSDLHDIERNPFGITLPRVLGHEGAGTIAAIGDRVSNFCIGESVTVHPVIPCRTCRNCQRGLGHLCLRMGHLGLDRDGTFAEFFCARADRVFSLPAGVEWPVAPLLEPIAVCLEALQRARLREKDDLLIVGDGPFGILLSRLARSQLTGRVILVGRHPFRLGQSAGAVTVLATDVMEARRTIEQCTGPDGVAAAILAVGNQAALDLCLASLRARGRLVLFSPLEAVAQLDTLRVHMQELEVIGSCNDENLADAALAALGNKSCDWSSLVTHHLPFSEWSQAFDLARKSHTTALKVAMMFESKA